MGAENLEDLKSKVETQMKTEYSDLTKNLDKKNLFEKLQKIHDFELPQDLIDAEFNNLSANYLQSQNPSSIDHQKEIKDHKLSAENEKKFLHQLSIEKFQSIEPKIDKRVFDILSPEKSISQKNSYGGTSTTQVKKAILRAKRKMRN